MLVCVGFLWLWGLGSCVCWWVGGGRAVWLAHGVTDIYPDWVGTGEAGLGAEASGYGMAGSQVPKVPLVPR